MEEVIAKEYLVRARSVLQDRDHEGGDATERLTLALCVLLDGFLERALEEWDDDT